LRLCSRKRVNEKLAPLGLSLISGSIDALEVSIPWANVLSGKVNITLSGLSLVVQAHAKVSLDQLATTADLAASFLDEEEDSLGVGAIPESAVVQRLLDTVLANLSIEVSRIKVTLLGSPSLKIDIQSAQHGPASEHSSMLTLSGISTSFCNARSRSSSVSSVSTEFSDAPELMQSTVFGNEESRSLYMSALGSVQQSALGPTHEAQAGPFATCHDGCVVLFDRNTGLVDIKCRTVQLDCTMLQLLHVQRTLEQLRPETTDNTVAPAISVSLEQLQANIAIGSSAVSLTFSAMSFDLQKMTGHLDLSFDLDGQQMLQQTVHFGGSKVKLDPVNARISIDAIFKLLSNLETFPKSSGGISESTLQLVCPSIDITATLAHSSIHLSLSHITYDFLSTAQRSRHRLQCQSASLSLDDLCLALAGTNIFDFTRVLQLPPQRWLDFDQYDVLFQEPQRTDQADAATVKAVKERFKGASEQVFRASLGHVTCSATPDSFKSLQVFHTLPETGNKSSSKPMSIFVEAERLTATLSIPSYTFTLKMHHFGLFAGHGVKEVDVLVFEASTCGLDVSGAHSTQIIRRGMHLDLHSKTQMLSIKVRRNLAGRTAGQVMLRVGLADLCIAHHAEMPWLEALQSAFASEPSATPFHAPHTALALDLRNISLALHPYATKAVGLLYFRRATAKGALIKSALAPIHMHAGILEFFLIDDIDGSQNDLKVKKKEDALVEPLLRLGFVHAASIETVEVNISFEQEEALVTHVNLSGAIFTIKTCADSTQTLISLLNMLKVPVEISKELKYQLGLNDDGTIPLDVFQSIDEQAFKNVAVTAQDAVVHEPVLVLDSDDAVDVDAMDEQLLSQSLIDLNRKSQKQSRCVLRVKLSNCFCVWNLYDGYDWQSTREKITHAVQGAIAKAQEPQEDDESDEEAEEVGDLLFNSIYLALPRGAEQAEVNAAINMELAQVGSDSASQATTVQPSQSRTPDLRLGRSKSHKVRFEVSGINLDFELMDAAEGEVLNHMVVAVSELEIFDNVATSTWRKFLTALRAKDGSERSIGSKMIMLDLLTVRPVAGLAAAELVIKANLLPLRLHVDQDTLEFMTRFFEFRDQRVVESSLPAEDLFIQRFEIMPFALQIDYKPKRVNLKSLRSGRTTEFKNFFILEDSSMGMRHVVLYGICGLSRVFELLEEIWLAHIKANQLGSVLAGVSAIRSLASFGGGLKKLVTVPVQEYRKDGQIVRGVRKGIAAFARSTGTEAVRLGAKLAVGTQGLLEQAEGYFVEPSEALAAEHPVSMYANQPHNLRQGVTQAINGMSRNVVTAGAALASLPRKIEGEEDARGAVRVAARSVPIAVIRPLIGTTEAISKTLLGLRNTMSPGQQKMNEDKYK
jgi:hypothetical protein